MNIHEYQAKSLLANYGVAVPRGEVPDPPESIRITDLREPRHSRGSILQKIVFLSRVRRSLRLIPVALRGSVCSFVRAE